MSAVNDLNGYPRHLVFWWIIPCKAISGVFRELSERFQVTVVCATDLSDERKQLGWEYPDFGKAEVLILPVEFWKNKVDNILTRTCDAVHFFNGVHAYEKILYPLRNAIEFGMPTVVMTEAHNNSFTGLKWLAKEIYVNLYLPIITRPLVRRTLFALCLSGSSKQALRSIHSMGWPKEKIYPFGYFSEHYVVDTPNAYRSKNEIHVPRLLCTGYLTLNKGHRVLLHALRSLKEQGTTFSCDITGYGPEEANLRAMSKEFHLDDCVFFRGVLPTSELDELMNSVDIFVAPGLHEPWGIRINEAIQAGLAIVISDGIGACELVKASGCGNVFVSGDKDSLVEALSRLITNPIRVAALKGKAVNYRENIHPKAAARYFEDVLRHAYERLPFPVRPSPPWL